MLSGDQIVFYNMPYLYHSHYFYSISLHLIRSCPIFRHVLADDPQLATIIEAAHLTGEVYFGVNESAAVLRNCLKKPICSY